MTGIAADIKVRMTTALRAPTHGMAWFALETGIFERHGLDVTFPAIETTGPEVAAGLMRGDWDFGHTGMLPVAERALKGGDVIALFRHTRPHANTFLATTLPSLADLQGKRIGVLSDATSGQTGVRVRLMLEKAGITASYPGLGSYGNTYKALAAGEIEAGALPVYLRLAGEKQYRWNIFEVPDVGAFVPSVFATTRRMIEAHRDVVMRVGRAYIATVHAFKTQPDVYIPVLQRFLNITDRGLAEDQYRFYVPLFERVPRLSLGDGLQSIRDVFAKTYPHAQKLQEREFVDTSVIDELERSGFIARLYGDSQ